MFRPIVPAMLLLFVLPGSAQEAAPATGPNKEVLQRAFDGAMTCSAVAAIAADDAAEDERWRWDNRSFAFGMLAARFYTEARGTGMTAEELNKALNDYAGALLEMQPFDREGFETNCQSKYAEMDKLCEENPCAHAGPPDPAEPSAEEAPAS